MNITTIVLIIIISFIATLIRSTFGFGESLVAVPLFALFLPIDTAVPLSVILSIIIALFVVVQDHRHVHLKSAKWLILFALPGIPLGLALLIYGNEQLCKTALGILIILYSLYALSGRHTAVLKKDNMVWLFICGFLSGIFGGAYGINGPALVVYGNMRRWSAKHFRATLQAYFLPASILGLAGYCIKGLVTTEVLKALVVALPAAVPAIFLGRYLNRRLTGTSFFRYIYIGLVAIGMVLICDTFR